VESVIVLLNIEGFRIGEVLETDLHAIPFMHVTVQKALLFIIIRLVN
jgi:hypothetical protein